MKRVPGDEIVLPNSINGHHSGIAVLIWHSARCGRRSRKLLSWIAGKERDLFAIVPAVDDDLLSCSKALLQSPSCSALAQQELQPTLPVLNAEISPLTLDAGTLGGRCQ